MKLTCASASECLCGPALGHHCADPPDPRTRWRAAAHQTAVQWGVSWLGVLGTFIPHFGRQSCTAVLRSANELRRCVLAFSASILSKGFYWWPVRTAFGAPMPQYCTASMRPRSGWPSVSCLTFPHDVSYEEACEVREQTSAFCRCMCPCFAAGVWSGRGVVSIPGPRLRVAAAIIAVPAQCSQNVTSVMWRDSRWHAVGVLMGQGRASENACPYCVIL